MASATVSTGMRLEYEVMGPDEGTPMLLIMGLAAQLIAWPDGFCRQLVDQGFRVIRFDNRDSGLSTTLEGHEVDLMGVIGAQMAGQPDRMPPVPYVLGDLAADAVGLLDHLGIATAHVVGASMGGMIAQQLAIDHPHRVRSLVSIMSMTGEIDFGGPTPEAAQVLLTPPPPDREGVIAASLAAQVWMSRRYVDAQRVQAEAARAYDRSFCPHGAVRQLAAIYASGSRAEALRELTVPTLVIHGRDDTLIAPSGGERTAALIPGASLMLLADMGHDLPEALWPIMTTVISRHAVLADSER